VDVQILFQEYIYALLQGGRYNEALSVCDHVLASDPYDYKVLQYKADAVISCDRTSEALDPLAQILGLIGAVESQEASSLQDRQLQSIHYNDRIIKRKRCNQGLFEKSARSSIKVRLPYYVS
jgi:hypothetical protein